MNPIHAQIDGTTYRVRTPQSDTPAPTLIMVHGYQGTEDVTWVFARTLAESWLVAAPRAPLPAGGGFAWNTFDPANGRAHPASFAEGVAHLTHFIAAFARDYPVDPRRLFVLGFSQGAAMTYAYAFQAATARERGEVTPYPPTGIVALGGFISSAIPKPYPPLANLPILMVHGTHDETIPVTLAHKNRDELIAVGGAVTYVEEAVGHRVGVNGMRALNEWLRRFA